MKTRSAIASVAFLFVLALLAACQGPQTQADRSAHDAAIARTTKGKELFEEKCRTVAGEKIYRTVRDVEGVLLVKIRPSRGDRELSDQMWPGAAFAREATGDEYITTFLGYEHSSSAHGEPVTPQYRGYIGTDYQPRNASNLAGYRFVDVVEPNDGRRYRYTGGVKDVTITSSVLIGGDGKQHVVKRYVLDRRLAIEPAPRYGVTFEDHVKPEERVLGIASSTIEVVDLETSQILGRLTRYAWSPGGPSRDNPVPWLTAYRCPDQAVGTGAATRKFVDQVLVPAGR